MGTKDTQQNVLGLPAATAAATTDIQDTSLIAAMKLLEALGCKRLIATYHNTGDTRYRAAKNLSTQTLAAAIRTAGLQLHTPTQESDSDE